MTPLPPDDKDWTWVLDRVCAECGFDAAAPARADLAPLAVEVGERWIATWGRAQAPGRRPAPLVWSPLEYTCHVRDVLDLAVYRTTLMRDEVDPLFANWDQDETAVQTDYAATDPASVGPELAASVHGYTALLETVGADEWDRAGRRSNGSVFTVESFTRYVLHDVVHHLTDVTGERWS